MKKSSWQAFDEVRLQEIPEVGLRSGIFEFRLCCVYNKGMNINLKTKGFDLTGAIEIYLREKLDSLDKILPQDESISADVELMRTTNHHNKGNIYRAEVNLAVSGRLIRAAAEEWDLRVAIDAAKDE